MLTLENYTITTHNRHTSGAERQILDPATGRIVAAVREEPWPEVFTRPFPDGTKGRPLLMRLLGVDSNPKESRAVVRRGEDGYAILRLHHRQPLFNRTVGIFDDTDARVGYCRWPFKGAGRPDEFDFVRVDQQRFAEVRRTAPGSYRVSGGANHAERAVITISQEGVDSRRALSCSVAVNGGVEERAQWAIFVLTAALLLMQVK